MRSLRPVRGLTIFTETPCRPDIVHGSRMGIFYCLPYTKDTHIPGINSVLTFQDAHCAGSSTTARLRTIISCLVGVQYKSTFFTPDYHLEQSTLSLFFLIFLTMGECMYMLIHVIHIQQDATG